MRIFFLLPLLTAVLSLSAAEYFVSASGSDDAPGSREAPFRTIGKAAALVQAGDVVTVRGGTYREQISIRSSGTAAAPIVFRGAPGETAVLTAGFAFPVAWQKTAGYRSVWENTSTYAVNQLWEKRRGSRYLRVESFTLLDQQPGAFLCSKADGKVYVHALEGRDPNLVGMVQVPWYGGKAEAGFSGGRTGDIPLPYNADTAGLYPWNKGFIVYGDYVTIENFQVSYFPGQAIRINAPAKHCVVRNNTVLAGTCGIMLYGDVEDCPVVGNRVSRVAGAGIQLTGSGGRCPVEGNFLFNNGSCPPFSGEDNASSGNIYNIAHYGSYELTDFKNNLVIGDDDDRRTNSDLMRCKGGIRKHSVQSGNVFVGGGVSLYAAPSSTALIANNTCVKGKFRVGKLSTEEVYAPEFKDNLFWSKSDPEPKFADPAHYDFRLRPDSPFLGQGAHPVPGPVLYVKAGLSGDGSTPEQALPTLAAALSRPAGKETTTIYLCGGTYSAEKAVFAGSVKLADYGHEPVVLEQLSLRGEGDLLIDGPALRNSSIEVAGTASCKRTFLAGSRVKADNLKLESCTLDAARVEAGALQLRDCLFAQPDSSITARECISENNAFVSSTALEEHRRRFPEMHPSFLAEVAIDAAGNIPAEHPLANSGLQEGPVGGRPAAAEVLPLQVERLQANPFLPDRCLVEWETPRHYCNVNIRGREVASGKAIPTYSFQQGMYMSTQGSHCLQNLKPDTEYALQLFFYRPNDPQPLGQKLSFRTPATDQHQATTLRVDKNTPAAYQSIRAALSAARPGDTIVVAPGVYTESLRVDIDRLTLRSEVPGQASLDAARLFDYALLFNGGADCTIDGFRFVGLRYSASAKALSASKVRNLTVRNCLFDRSRGGGRCSNIQFFAYQVDGLLVENCVFDSGFHGIWTYPAKNVVIRNNTFWGNGINGIHVGCNMGDRTEIYNNLLVDTVSNHQSPAVTVADHGPHVFCDYNLYWKTEVAPKQRYYSFGRHSPEHEYSAPWSVKSKDLTDSLAETQQRYGVEAHGLEADPLFVDALNGDFSLTADSPARGRGREGKNLGADFAIFK